MVKADIFEHVRTLLRDAQADLGIGETQFYTDDELVLHVRSALRHLIALGVPTTAVVVLGVTADAVMTTGGVLSPEPTDSVGVLIALKVVITLLRGDMIKRVTSGEFGVLFSMGNDTIDTKTAAIQFKNTADDFEEDYRNLLTLILSDLIKTLDVYGGPKAPGHLN
jgi:hypothetical protein